MNNDLLLHLLENGLSADSRHWEYRLPISLSKSYCRVAMSYRTQDSSLSTLAAHGPHILLWTAATRAMYTICRADGQVICREPFDTAPHNAAAATETAARQAVWIAGCVRNNWGANAATLHLVLNNRRGVDVGRLESYAFTVGLVLDLNVAPVRNPAVRLRENGTYIDWRRAELGPLIQTSPPRL
ncbi:hypothetical protein ACFVMC_29010 [Nocardia sp. NPDC127579]|uniref:hypothetical protein n=1 Tax=Nocardia sp. NPDC127579 TaxID=3345402 RepID=UPI00362721ED